MAHWTVGVFVGVFALLMALGLFCTAVAITTAHLGDDDSEPEPHRPIWR